MPDQQRKLAAIVFTDIVGFTKLTADDQQKAIDLLDLQRSELKPIVESHGGKWVKEMGDGLILTFDTITNAVQCCLKFQEKAKSIDHLSLRIGIHLGEIMEKEGDIIGDDVNVASRIEPFSAPGGIAISNKVNDALVREKEFTTKYLGKPQLKGVGQEVKVYCITSHDLPETDLSQVSAKLEPEGFQWNVKNSIGVAASVLGLLFLINFMFLRIGYADKDETPSIAILPFENKGAEADEFYAYGISSDLIADVTGAGLIRVASLKDIEKIKFQEMETADLAKKLFVRYVAQGTLWKMDSVFQLSMEIFDTKESKVVYTKRWQTDWTDLATIKDDLSDNILETLEIKILQDPEKQIADSNPKAYAYYLEAMHKYDKREDAGDIEIARELLNRAIILDDNIIAAKLLLGTTYSIVGDYDKAMSIYTSALDQAEDLGNKEALGAALGNIGVIHYYKGDPDQTLDYFKRSIEIYEDIGDKANYGKFLSNIGVIYNTKGELDQALDYFNRSLAISEELGEKNNNAYTNIGIIYGKRGEYDQALDYFNRSLAISEEVGDKNSNALSYTNIGLVHNARGEYDQALDYIKRALKIFEELGNKRSMGNSLNNIGEIHSRTGDYDQALDYLYRSLAISEELGNKFGAAGALGGIANNYFNKGEYDKSLDYFTRSLAISEELGYTGNIRNILNMIGNIHFQKSEYEQAADYYTQSIKINEELGEEHKLYLITNLSLANKHLGKEYDIQEIHKLIEETDEIDYETNFKLYGLLEDNSYLETAYIKLQELADALDDETKGKFLNYPIPKQIIEAWETVNT